MASARRTVLGMLEPIHGRQGEVVGWLDDERRIRDLRGAVVAYIQRDGSINTQGGRSCGVLDRGFFRDRNGGAVAFLKGAAAGPVPPVPHVPPVAPVPVVPPVSPVPPVPPVPAVPQLNWSHLSWEEFIAGP